MNVRAQVGARARARVSRAGRTSGQAGRSHCAPSQPSKHSQPPFSGGQWPWPWHSKPRRELLVGPAPHLVRVRVRVRVRVSARVRVRVRVRVKLRVRVRVRANQWHVRGR